MKRTISYLGAVIVTALLTLSIVAAAQASASKLRIIGRASSSGQFAAAAANGSKKHAKALYIRGYGHGLSGFAAVACSKGLASIGSKSTTFRSMKSGRLYRLRMPFKGDCEVTASLGGSGRIRLQILAA